MTRYRRSFLSRLSGCSYCCQAAVGVVRWRLGFRVRVRRRFNPGEAVTCTVARGHPWEVTTQGHLQLPRRLSKNAEAGRRLQPRVSSPGWRRSNKEARREHESHALRRFGIQARAEVRGVTAQKAPPAHMLSRPCQPRMPDVLHQPPSLVSTQSTSPARCRRPVHPSRTRPDTAAVHACLRAVRLTSLTRTARRPREPAEPLMQ